MFQRAFGAAAVLVLVFGVAAADEINGRIQKIAGDKITVGTKFDKETKKFSEEKTFTLAKDVKVLNATFNKEEKKVTVGTPVEGGLKNERLQNLGERGVRAQIVTNTEGQVTEIRLFPPRKKQ
jgi:hypothetical protein